MSMSDHLSTLVDGIKAGRILETFDELYAENVTMQENANEPVKGKAANREREIAFLDQVKEWKSLEINASAASGEGGTGVSFVEYEFDFIDKADNPVHYEQVAVQRWEGGKVVHERFYYDAS